MHNRLLARNPDSVASTLYVEDVFSTYLYTGNGTSQTLTTGVNMTGNGGMVWVKGRNSATTHVIYDTVRGATAETPITTGAQTTQAQGVTAFSSTGFSVGNLARVNGSGTTFAAWSFAKSARFFDVITYTGTGGTSRWINHGLGVVPGMIIVKRTDTAGANWLSIVSTSDTQFNAGSSTSELSLNTTNGPANVSYNKSGYATATQFNTNTFWTDPNTNGATYVAYLFAHDTASDGIIKCNGFTTDSSGNASISLGWEPQFVIAKCVGAVESWLMYDTMRGIPTGYSDYQLVAEASTAEAGTANNIEVNATGFSVTGLTASKTYAFMAIRRGPMRVPTDGTTVFQPLTRTGTGVTSTVTTNITADLVINKIRGSAAAAAVMDRMRDNAYLFTTSTAGDTSSTTISPAQMFDNQFGFDVTGTNLSFNSASGSYISYIFRRAPSFFDTVCYTGTGTATAITHNLGVAPELMLIKSRTGATTAFNVYAGSNTSAMILNSTAVPATSATYWNNTSPTATQFTVGTGTGVNTSGATYVAYLFASCSGVSKVGTYTGNGTSLDINCGFTNGARFVMIKRTDAVGDWYTFDTGRGIIAANDPYFVMNTTAAEVTTADSVDPLSTGFTVVQNATSNINVSSGTYLYLAIA